MMRWYLSVSVKQYWKYSFSLKYDIHTSALHSLVTWSWWEPVMAHKFWTSSPEFMTKSRQKWMSHQSNILIYKPSPSDCRGELDHQTTVALPSKTKTYGFPCTRFQDDFLPRWKETKTWLLETQSRRLPQIWWTCVLPPTAWIFLRSDWQRTVGSSTKHWKHKKEKRLAKQILGAETG